MPFFNQHLEFKVDFDTNFNIGLSNLRPVLNDLFQKFYTLYYSSNVVHFLNIDDEILKFLDMNFITLSKFVKQIKPIKYEALTIELLLDGQMIVSSSNIIFQNKNDKFIFIKKTNPKLKIYIKDKYAIFIGGMHKNRFNFFEATLSSISKICENSVMMREFFYIYFAFLSKLHRPLKDIELDFIKSSIGIKSPFKFSSLENFLNKKELFISKYPKETFLNSVNKNSLCITYAFLKMKKYIPAPYFEVIANFALQNSNKFNWCNKYIDLAQEILAKYLLSKIVVENKYKDEIDDYRDIFYDYIEMAFIQKEDVNLKIKSFKRLKAEHDRLMLKITTKKLPEVKVSDKSQFLKLKLPKDIKMLMTKKEIVEEGIINHNCVASYINKVNAQKCIICSLRKGDKRYTIEIGQQRNEFCLIQIRGLFNTKPPDEVIEYVNNVILANNKKIQQIQ